MDIIIHCSFTLTSGASEAFLFAFRIVCASPGFFGTGLAGVILYKFFVLIRRFEKFNDFYIPFLRYCS